MFKLMKRFRKNESGATAIEYGLIAALVGVAIITTVGQVGTDLGLTFTEVSNALTGTAPNGGGN